MKIQKIDKDIKTFNGQLTSVYEYNTKNGVPIIILNCLAQDGYTRTSFSNYKSKFEELSSGIDTVEPGTPVEVTYTEYTSPSNNIYKNFKSVSFKPAALSAQDITDIGDYYDIETEDEMPF